MPLTIEEYQIGQLFSVAEASRQETGGSEGVQVVTMSPSKAKVCSMAASPKCRLSLLSMNNRGKTELTNPDYRKDDFLIRIETMHLSDRGTTKNALGLSKGVLNERKVVRIDIANDKISLCHHPALSDFICGVNESIDRQVDAARSARHFIHKRHKRYILKDAVIMRILADASYNSNGEISDLMSALGLQVEGYAGKLRDFENYDYSIVHVPY
ncbi:hypothetical protein niasHT_032534 [Heterodera trifolii]|uniref:Phosphatidylinositol transfer protein N-terminal domain-containing protein n=1 Tax=Heterodera trifolii TaxID=157864 RepID=A0ABD2HXN5_9BILA